MFDLPPPDPSIEIVAATHGISKGLGQTDGAQLLVRGELGLGDVYLGTYGKNIDTSSAEGEAGLLIGLRKKVGGFEIAGSAAYKRLISAPRGADVEALEMVGSVTRKFGPLTGRVALTWSPDDLGSTGRSAYFETGATYKVAPSTTVGASISRREREGDDYRAMNVGITQILWKGISADLRWYDTNREALGDQYKNRLVGSLRAKF